MLTFQIFQQKHWKPEENEMISLKHWKKDGCQCTVFYLGENSLLRWRQSENLSDNQKNLREFVAAIEILNEVLLTKGKMIPGGSSIIQEERKTARMNT